MRLWSIHPQYLDTKGLTAVWSEGILAQKVLIGDTADWKNPDAWKNHPQLDRFKLHSKSVDAIGIYLWEIWQEAERRGFNFNKKKIYSDVSVTVMIEVSKETLKEEFEILKGRLKDRAYEKYLELKLVKHIEPHPIFTVVE